MKARFTAARLAITAAAVLALALPARAAAQQTPAPPAQAAAPKDLPLTAEQRQAYVGTYDVSRPDGEKVTLRIFEEDGVLKGQPSDNPTEVKRLMYQGDNVFVPEGVPMTLAFTVVDGRATKFTFTQRDGEPHEAVRAP
ncbi:MAG TPA: hypothetical protein VF092_20025 [Longimicrobium sp.]